MTADAASYVAFAGDHRIASGDLATVALAVKARLDGGDPALALIFDATTSEQVELDLRGSADDVVNRLPRDVPADPDDRGAEAPARRAVGRPRLGVVAREVTLLPRHWEWLASQPGGASVTLRKLVEAARRDSGGADRVRDARESAYRFMHAVAGNEPGFEEATRALFAGDADAFDARTEAWPPDVREHARLLARRALPGGDASPGR